ncbi:MAG TPA: hypothetical protein VFX35_01315 [Solirubrobacterales bacterium]|nr:hypothetical protein [Solirubrobacterales bacterium]
MTGERKVLVELPRKVAFDFVHGRYEPFQRAKRAVKSAIKDALDSPQPNHLSDQEVRERLTSDDVIRAANAASREQHHFRPYPEITKTLLEAAYDAAYPKQSSEECDGSGELWTKPPEGHIGSMKYPCPGCPKCQSSEGSRET